MTAIEKVLLRKDAVSLIVAIILAASTIFLLNGLVTPFTTYLSFSDQFQGRPPVGDMVLQSVISFVAQLIVLELLIRLVVLTRGRLYKKGK